MRNNKRISEINDEVCSQIYRQRVLECKFRQLEERIRETEHESVTENFIIKSSIRKFFSIQSRFKRLVNGLIYRINLDDFKPLLLAEE